MIPFDFEYYKPLTVNEAFYIYQELQSQNKRVIYYAGGTEFISMARLGQLIVDAVIDIKDIQNCNTLENKDGHITLGSAVSLAKLITADLFPLLSRQSLGIADHSSRHRITLGGNIASAMAYREAILPFLLCDSQVVVACTGGVKTVAIHEVFDRQLRLSPGEFVVQLKLAAADAKLPSFYVKKTRFSNIDYPLVSLAAIYKDKQMRLALSGICTFPFRSQQMEADLNDQNRPLETRIEHALSHLPEPAMGDLQGSAEYRKFLLSQILSDAVQELEVGVQ